MDAARAPAPRRAPRGAAAALWFGLNVAAALAVAALGLHREPPGPAPLATGLAAALFPPVVGVLLVGQTSLLTALGAALAAWALAERRGGWLAVAVALLALKPHLGLLPLLAAVALARSRRLAAALLVAALLAAGTAWPAALARFAATVAVACDTCAGAPRALSPAHPGLAALALAPLVPATAWRLRHAPPDRAIAAACALTPLVLPYLRNYDYAVLMVPWLVVARERPAAAALAWLGPALALGFGRAAPPACWWSSAAILLVALGWRR
ncbi:MAG: glycosyltransferase 87 family protein [Myxococcota bacterium]